MGMGARDGIHQAFFGWNPGVGQTLLSSSFDGSEAELWRARLRNHVRIPVATSSPSAVRGSRWRRGEGASAG